jgi:hypothetical protein
MRGSCPRTLCKAVNVGAFCSLLEDKGRKVFSSDPAFFLSKCRGCTFPLAREA